MEFFPESVAEVMAAYERGKRLFTHVRIEHADVRGRRLEGATFVKAEFPGATFWGALLESVCFVDSNLTAASFADADLWRMEFSNTCLRNARFTKTPLQAVLLDRVDASGADLSRCDLKWAQVVRADLGGATLDGVRLGGSTFTDTDLTPLLDAEEVVHEWPSNVDLRSVLRSYRHPGLKQFLVDCGMPEAFADYTIEAARAEGEGALESLMRSTFISYGGPDEAFARRLYEALRDRHVTTFFFPETARIGRRIGDEVHSRIQEHDRVILVCSRDSLDRPGVRNEIQETFDREARDGGATYLLPIMLDDYVLSGWDDPLAQRVRDRVVGDFRGADGDEAVFGKALDRLLAALRKHPA